jgi:hypothetical protein
LRRLGHLVTYFEHYGWPTSCYDAGEDVMTADPGYGTRYLTSLLEAYAPNQDWCYLAEDGTNHGMPRERLGQLCAEADIHLNLSNINWVPELEQCRRRVLVDTDPVFTQIGAHGIGGPFARYDRLFTYGENVHKLGCCMPTGGSRWLPTRQPIVLDLWNANGADPFGPFTSVFNWSAYGDHRHRGQVYGQKDREFEPFFSLPRVTGEAMELAVQAPKAVRRRLLEGGWRLADPLTVTRDPSTFQDYVRNSRAEFSVAKHGYVATRCGWFSDRSAAYLAMGRPVVTQDTGFTEVLGSDTGLLAFQTAPEAATAIQSIDANYDRHSVAARALAEEYFDADRILTHMLERIL